MTLMLAADLCRHLLRERPPALLAALQRRSAGGEEVVISAVTYAELLAAALLARDQEKHMDLVREFSERLDRVVPWDSGAVETYTAIQTRAMAAGERERRHSLNMNDAMLAAHALSLGAVLLTLSDSSFARIEGLKLEAWPLP